MDTSALVAYYIPEPKSDEVNRLLGSVECAAISTLTEVELVSAVSRRVRAAEISREDGQRVVSRFLSQVDGGLYRMFPLARREHGRARELLGSFEHPLRTLDALHLAVVLRNDLVLVTADVALKETARRIGAPVLFV
ncbi:MAG: type II toxin-antitoxin system VapC family toxin [Polyangia bacterium]